MPIVIIILAPSLLGNVLFQKSDHNVKLSRALSYILRHGAAREGLQMTEGFVFVDDLLKLRQFKHYCEDDIRQVVANNDKQRFALRDDPSTKRLQIRANQGHTMQVDDIELELITDHTKAPVVLHGTYRDCWPQIKAQGLSRMKRNHIHFAPGEPGEEGVISGQLMVVFSLFLFPDNWVLSASP